MFRDCSWMVLSACMTISLWAPCSFTVPTNGISLASFGKSGEFSRTYSRFAMKSACLPEIFGKSVLGRGGVVVVMVIGEAEIEFLAV